MEPKEAFAHLKVVITTHIQFNSGVNESLQTALLKLGDFVEDLIDQKAAIVIADEMVTFASVLTCDIVSKALSDNGLLRTYYACPETELAVIRLIGRLKPLVARTDWSGASCKDKMTNNQQILAVLADVQKLLRTRNETVPAGS